VSGFIKVTDQYGEPVIIARDEIRLVENSSGQVNHGWYSCYIHRHGTEWGVYARESHEKVWAMLQGD
jgi:hypothetical protein